MPSVIFKYPPLAVLSTILKRLVVVDLGLEAVFDEVFDEDFDEDFDL